MADRAPGANLDEMHTFYVRKHPSDSHGLEQVISDELNAMGYSSTSGPGERPTVSADVIVSYEDKWMWDITMYMLQIDIELRDPETEAILVTGQSYRTSMVRKSKETMVKETLCEMFGREQRRDDSEEE
jgi:hypothetical protein